MSSAAISLPPSYFVVVAVLPTASDGPGYLHQLAQVPGMKAVKQSGLDGDSFVGSENSGLNQGNPLSDPTASEGVLALVHGATVFEAFAITAHPSAARTFLASFEPA